MNFCDLRFPRLKGLSWTTDMLVFFVSKQLCKALLPFLHIPISANKNLFGSFGQDFYQTYARITGNQRFAQIFLGPFLASKQENKQNISREALFLFRAKVGLREALVIVPSESSFKPCQPLRQRTTASC